MYYVLYYCLYDRRICTTQIVLPIEARIATWDFSKIIMYITGILLLFGMDCLRKLLTTNYLSLMRSFLLFVDLF